MKVVTSSEMYQIEKEGFEKLGLPSLMFMEYAAMKVVEHGMEALKGIKNPKVVVVTGSGNNGGDGLAAARHFCLKKIDVTIIYVGDMLKSEGSAAINLRAAANLSIPVIKYPNSDNVFNIAYTIEKSNLVIDALIGIGINRPVSPVYEFIIDNINSYGKYIISVDISSGVSADTGEILGKAVKADKTVTFAYPKLGLIMHPGAEYAGEYVVEDIHIPDFIINSMYIPNEVLQISDVGAALPVRKPNSNKGTFGKVFAVAGCDEMPGAAVLCVNAAYKTGCGLVRACVTQNVAREVTNKVTECVTTVLPDEAGYLCERSFRELSHLLPSADVIILGPGLGANHDVEKLVLNILTEAEVPIIIDADALNVMDLETLKKCGRYSVITPHPLEMSRLTGIPINDIITDPINTAKNFAREYDIVTVLKGSRTVIASPGGNVYINTTGNSALAKAGTGDVLTGIIAALIAQGMDTVMAAAAGCYIHGMAGSIASEILSEYGVLASDVIEYIPHAIKKITSQD